MGGGLPYYRTTIHAMVSHFGAIFSPVASGTAVVCKNNTTVLGRSGRAGARQKKEQGKHIRILGDHDFTMARSANAHMPR